MFIGLLWLPMGVAGLVIAVLGDGVVHFVMEGLRGVFFGLCGIAFVAAAVTCDGDLAKSILRDFVRDTLSRRNLTEFAAFWVVVGIAVGVMLLLRH